MVRMTQAAVAALGLVLTTSQVWSTDIPKAWSAPYVAHYAIELGESAEKPAGNAVDVIDQVLESARRHGSRLERGEFDCLVKAGEMTTAGPGEPSKVVQRVLRRVVVQFDDPAGLVRQQVAMFSKDSSQAHEWTSIRTPEGGLRLHDNKVVQYSGAVPDDWDNTYGGQPLDPRVLPWSTLDWMSRGTVAQADLQKIYAKEHIRFAGWVDGSHVEICWLVRGILAISVVFDARRDYLPVTLLMRQPTTSFESETVAYNAVQFVTTDWKLKGGIFVPIRTKMWNGEFRPKYMEVNVFWGSVNQPLDPQDFTLESLLLLPDARIQEQVNGKIVDVGRIDKRGQYHKFSTAAEVPMP